MDYFLNIKPAEIKEEIESSRDNHFLQPHRMEEHSQETQQFAYIETQKLYLQGINKGLSLNQYISLLPKFNGDSSSLENFCQSIRRIFRIFATQAEPANVTVIAQKLEGRTSYSYLAYLSQYHSIEKFLGDSTVQYGFNEEPEKILAQLEDILEA